MKVIRQRNNEEEQHHGADECAPFPPSRVAPEAGLPRPPGAPCDHACQRDQDPKNIEKYLHFSLCIGPQCTASLPPESRDESPTLNLLCEGTTEPSLAGYSYSNGYPRHNVT